MNKRFSTWVGSIIIFLSAATLFAEPFLGNTAKKNQSTSELPAVSNQVISPSDFSTDVSNITQKNHEQFKQQLDKRIADLKAPHVGDSPDVKAAQQSTSTSQKESQPAATPPPSDENLETPPPPPPPKSQTPPPDQYSTTPPPANNNAPSHQQSYTGFQSGSGGQSQEGESANSGGWNVQY